MELSRHGVGMESAWSRLRVGMESAWRRNKGAVYLI